MHLKWISYVLVCFLFAQVLQQSDAQSSEQGSLSTTVFLRRLVRAATTTKKATPKATTKSKPTTKKKAPAPAKATTKPPAKTTVKIKVKSAPKPTTKATTKKATIKATKKPLAASKKPTNAPTTNAVPFLSNFLPKNGEGGVAVDPLSMIMSQAKEMGVDGNLLDKVKLPGDIGNMVSGAVSGAASGKLMESLQGVGGGIIAAPDQLLKNAQDMASAMVPGGMPDLTNLNIADTLNKLPIPNIPGMPNPNDLFKMFG